MVRFMYAPTRFCVKSGNLECNQGYASMYTYSNVIPKIGMPVVQPHVKLSFDFFFSVKCMFVTLHCKGSSDHPLDSRKTKLLMVKR